MPICYLFSGFDEEKGFSEEIANFLEKDMKNRNLLLFISSSPDSPDKTDRYAQSNVTLFQHIGIVFHEVRVLDFRVNQTEAAKLVEKASCIVLMGGNPIRQFAFLQEYQLDEVMKKTDAVICGISAGAINMGVQSLCSKDKDIEETIVYSGLGLVDVTVEPHYLIENENPIQEELLAISQKFPIYGIGDGNAIRVENHKLMFIGDIYKIENGEVIHLNEKKIF